MIARWSAQTSMRVRSTWVYYFYNLLWKAAIVFHKKYYRGFILGSFEELLALIFVHFNFTGLKQPRDTTVTKNKTSNKNSVSQQKEQVLKSKYSYFLVHVVINFGCWSKDVLQHVAHVYFRCIIYMCVYSECLFYIHI